MNKKRCVIFRVIAASVFCVASQTSYAGSFYSFGDSLTDNGISVREYGGVIGNAPGRYPGADGKFTNGQTWAEVLPGLTGLRFEATNGYAIGGARSGYIGNDDTVLNAASGFLTQVDNFRDDLSAQAQTLGEADLIGIWIGTNDIFVDSSSAALDEYVLNINTGILRLQSLGAKNFVIIGADDISLLEAPSSFPNPYLEAISAASQSFNNKLLSMDVPGANIYYFDVLTLLQNVVNEPAAYGFSHTMAVDNCEANKCDTLSFEEQNTYLMKDAIHYTDSFERLIAEYIGNIINARNTVKEQAPMADFAGTSFLHSLLDRYDIRALYRNDSSGAHSNWQVFIKGGTARGADHSKNSVIGLDLNQGSFSSDSLVVGIDYKVTETLTLGTAFNYSDLDSNHASEGGSNTELEILQGAIFASYADQGLFGNVAIGYGMGEFDISRAGIMENLRASPDATVFSAAAQVGQWYRLAYFDIAPVAGLAYTKSKVDSYHERGDSLLTMGVGRQSYEMLTGSLGLQIGKIFQGKGRSFESLLSLTAEKQLIASDRIIKTFQLNAPNFTIQTPIDASDRHTTGRLTAQIGASLPSGLGFKASAATTVGHDREEDLFMVGVDYAF